MNNAVEHIKRQLDAYIERQHAAHPEIPITALWAALEKQLTVIMAQTTAD